MKFKSKICLLITIGMLAFGYAQKKSSISILYVGFDPSKPIPEKMDIIRAGAESPEHMKEDYPKRMPSFEKLLKQYFNEVKTVDAREYKESISDSFDITIFDQAPNVIKERVRHVDSVTGQVTGVEPPQYVSPEYNRPSLFIGHTASMIGSSLGSKLDWLCLCLDKHAHHIKLDHEIFKGPIDVELTIENEPTPEGIFHYPDGHLEPKEIPMWQVNTTGYSDDGGVRVGLVSRGMGFEDSPDAEVISSGVCTKDRNAVALGRHGNFFLWGFAGSPDYMTEEAKKVFINSIHYLFKNRGNHLIARKFNEGIATRKYADQLYYNTTYEAFKFYVDYNKKNAEIVNKLKEKQASGETLNEDESRIVQIDVDPGTREDFVKKYLKRQSWINETGFDTLKIRKFISENKEFFYSDPEDKYLLQVDNIAKSWEISNSDIKLLEKAIYNWEKGIAVIDSRKVLLRYTLEDFQTPGEWKKWLKKNKKQMFFTEAGGYVWMINNVSSNPLIKPRTENEIAEILN